MKKLMIAAAFFAAGTLFAAEAEKAEAPAPQKEAPQIEESDDPIVWGFGNYGIYSGYQLYGSLVNSQPTMQGYLEANVNLIGNLSLGIGCWSNTDLTDKRRSTLGKAFNEYDPNIHLDYKFYFDDDEKWALAYRSTIVWYYYPHRRHDHLWGSIHTTMDWNHYFELENPYLTPFINVVHEYHESDGNLLQFGVKRTLAFADRKDFLKNLTITPSATFVWRNRNYGWCFPNFGYTPEGRKINSCLATMVLELDFNYQISDHFGLFAKVASCTTLDGDMRDAADYASGPAYGKYKDFAWGGLGVTVNF